MVNPSSSRTRNAVRRGALGLALALPLLTTLPARAQAEADSDQSSEEQIQLEDALTGENTDPQSAPQAVEVEAFEGVEEAPVAAEDEDVNQPRVLITEVMIDGIDGHPEQERVELAAYDAMTVRPGSRVTRDELKVDLEAIYATGWFSDVRIEPVNGPLGVQLVVQVVPNPVLTKVELLPEDNEIPPQVIEDAFSSDYGRTLNLSELQLRMKELQTWYASEGYALARVTGPTRVSPDGVVQLKVVVGTVAATAADSIAGK